MKNLLLTSTIVTALITPSFANAEAAEQKQWRVGVSSYAVVVASDYYDEDDEFSGFAISSDYAISDNFAVRGAYYWVEHDDFSDIEASGFDILGYFGTGLMSQGFKAYIGGGLYSETVEVSGFDEDFSGAQLNGGIGYNWKSVALDFSLGIRTTDDYEDFYDDGGDLVAASGSLALSLRF